MCPSLHNFVKHYFKFSYLNLLYTCINKSTCTILKYYTYLKLLISRLQGLDNRIGTPISCALCTTYSTVYGMCVLYLR